MPIRMPMQRNPEEFKPSFATFFSCYRLNLDVWLSFSCELTIPIVARIEVSIAVTIAISKFKVL